MNKIIITIDGYVATGKGTTAQGLAKLLDYRYLDTGAMYRAVTLYAIRNNLLNTPEDKKTEMLSQISLSFHRNKNYDHSDIYLNDENVEHQIRDPKLSKQMKPIVISPAVRAWLGAEQYRIGKDGGIVVDGRDMGTVVFPHAQLKLFLVGNKQIRAERRFKEMVERGHPTSIEEVIKDIEQRDATDYLSNDAVNYRAEDAIEIDTSILTIEEQIKKVYALAMERIKNK